MDIEKLQEFFLWCMVINIGIYFLTVFAVLVFRHWVCRIQEKLFGISEETVRKSIFMYIASYKLLITFFNFVPWVVILMIK